MHSSFQWKGLNTRRVAFLALATVNWGISATPATAQDAAASEANAAAAADVQPAGGVTAANGVAEPPGPAVGAGSPSSLAPPPQSRFIQEIVVTAQKREEAIQDVPISIAAFSGAELDARGLVTLRDLGMATPGLQFTDLAGYTMIYLRGVGTDAFIPSSDPSVATYLDGIYFPSSHSLAQSFGALERIEVLKGPQGTLFGRNSTGGAISVVTKKPGPEFETSIQASYGRFNDLKTRAYVNIPMLDTFAVSVSGMYNHADSYYTLDNPEHEHLLPDSSSGARVRARWFPSSNFDITLTGMQISRNGSTSALSVTTHPTPLAKVLSEPTETRDYVATDDAFPSLKTDTLSYYGESTARFHAFDVKALGSFYKVKAYNFQYDFDASARPIVAFQTNNEFQKIKTGELQIISNNTSWGSRWLKWLGGLYYLDSTGGYDPAFLSIANTVVNLPTGDVVRLVPQSLIDLLGPVPAPSQVGLYFHGLLGTKSYSGFLQSTATFTDWLDLTFGGRFQREKRALLVSNVEIDNLAGARTTLIPYAPRSATVSNFSPKVTLDVRPYDDVLLYASFSEGFKSATYNIVNIYLPPDYVQPERVTAYEVGAKSTFLNGRLRLNAAVFQNTIDHLQTAFVSLLSGGAVSFQNAGQARIRGAEFDSTVLPLPGLDPELVLTAGASYLHAIYTDFKDGQGFDENTGLYFKGRDFSGNDIVRTPRFTGNLGLGQTIETRWGPLELAADYYHNSGFYYLAQNSPVSREPAYDVLNARISYLCQPCHTRVTVFGENLINEHYDIQQFHTDFGRADVLAPPVALGVRVNVDF